jgi:hypothetical protein
MAQHKLAKAANGTGVEGVAATSDATSLSGAECWFIIGASATRESAIANLKDILYYMQSTRNSFPFA